MQRRWYDSNNETKEILNVLKELDNESRSKLSQDLIQVVRQIKEIHREESEPELSIGIQRVLGLYQSSNSRRWYDKNRDLNYALKTMSTLPSEDFYNIMEGLYVSLNN